MEIAIELTKVELEECGFDEDGLGDHIIDTLKETLGGSDKILPWCYVVVTVTDKYDKEKKEEW
jgi:hypothetical protein